MKLITSEKEFEKAIKRKRLTIIIFTATWCKFIINKVVTIIFKNIKDLVIKYFLN
jgi:hypothetical protein